MSADSYLKGHVGHARESILNRLGREPFNSIEWLRADLTGEKVTEFDTVWDHIWNRPFKNFSGDISGRYLEAMAMVDADERPNGLFDELMEETLKHQQPGGYFSAFGPISWEEPIDVGDLYTVRMMPALWGNSRMFCGLISAYESTRDERLLESAIKLGDFYGDILPRFTDDKRMAEYKMGDTFAAGYVTCYFPAMEGLMKLHQLCGENRFLETVRSMAEFYSHFNTIPIDHSHGMLCCQVGLLGIYESTGEEEYLRLVEERWSALVEGGYINPAGGILEKCRPVFRRDEGCALVDWLRLNLELARLTGNCQYWEMAERILQNHLLLNQCETGGFGHRDVVTSENGVVGFTSNFEESTWCCGFHGLLGFELLKNYLCTEKDSRVELPLTLDFESSLSGLQITSAVEQQDDSSFRQVIRLSSPRLVSVRVPRWAGNVDVSEAMGEEIPHSLEGEWLVIAEQTEVLEITYTGCRHSEEHPPNGSETKTYNYLGPWILEASHGQCAIKEHKHDRKAELVFLTK